MGYWEYPGNNSARIFSGCSLVLRVMSLSCAANPYKPWTTEDDIQIVISGEKSDSALAYDFQRSPDAIHWRRATLAAYMHKLCPDVSLQCCCLRVKGNINLATTIVSETALDEVLETPDTALRNIVLRLAARTPVAEDGAPIKPFSSSIAEKNYFEMPEPIDFVETNTCTTVPASDRDIANLACVQSCPYNIHLEAVKAISQLVRSENGKLQKLWNDPDMVPYLIMYYPGFQALSANIVG